MANERRKSGIGSGLAPTCAALAVLSMTGCAGALPATGATVPSGGRYVAMGSSFAAGPGVTHLADETSPQCQRSADNYAQQLALKRHLSLVDVSCGGATTANVLGRWGKLPPQIDALTADTRLVTVTIGGNDVGYIASLFVASCQGPSRAEKPSFCRPAGGRDPQTAIGVLRPPPDRAWNKVELALEQIVKEVRQRAPLARLIFVDYLTVLPDGELCAATPLAPADATTTRQTARRLAQLTQSVAARTGAEVVKASALSRGHDACAKQPWVTGFTPEPGNAHFAAYHPNLEGMTAVARAVDRQLSR